MRTRYGVIPFSNQDQPCYSQLSNTILPSSLVDLPHVNVIQHLDDEIIRTRTLHYQPKECPHITQSSILVNGWWNFRYSASSTIKYYKLQLNYKYKLGTYIYSEMHQCQKMSVFGCFSRPQNRHFLIIYCTIHYLYNSYAWAQICCM